MDARAGRNVVKFSGRLSRTRRLRLGRHRLAMTPRDAAGNTGNIARKRFRIVRRR
jgi:hypothetical protein